MQGAASLQQRSDLDAAKVAVGLRGLLGLDAARTRGIMPGFF